MVAECYQMAVILTSIGFSALKMDLRDDSYGYEDEDDGGDSGNHRQYYQLL